MKLTDGRITILAQNSNGAAGDCGVTIELRDDESNTTFARVKLSSEQWIDAMSRQSYVKCEIDVHGLDRVGKKMIMQKDFKFVVGDVDIPYDEQNLLAKEKAFEVCPDGWIPDTSFSSRDSLWFENGKLWASTTLRKWIDIDEEERNE